MARTVKGDLREDSQAGPTTDGSDHPNDLNHTQLPSSLPYSISSATTDRRKYRSVRISTTRIRTVTEAFKRSGTGAYGQDGKLRMGD